MSSQYLILNGSSAAEAKQGRERKFYGISFHLGLLLLSDLNGITVLVQITMVVK